MFNHGNTKHGFFGTPTYASWGNMHQRAGKVAGYEYVSVCEAWSDFDQFLSDMGVRPEGTTLDRIDNEGDYAPGNCRWATPAEQSRNRRNCRHLTHRQTGETKTAAEWSVSLGYPRTSFYRHLDAGKLDHLFDCN